MSALTLLLLLFGLLLPSAALELAAPICPRYQRFDGATGGCVACPSRPADTASELQRLHYENTCRKHHACCSPDTGARTDATQLSPTATTLTVVDEFSPERPGSIGVGGDDIGSGSGDGSSGNGFGDDGERSDQGTKSEQHSLGVWVAAAFAVIAIGIVAVVLLACFMFKMLRRARGRQKCTLPCQGQYHEVDADVEAGRVNEEANGAGGSEEGDEAIAVRGANNGEDGRAGGNSGYVGDVGDGGASSQGEGGGSAERPLPPVPPSVSDSSQTEGPAARSSSFSEAEMTPLFATPGNPPIYADATYDEIPPRPGYGH